MQEIMDFLVSDVLENPQTLWIIFIGLAVLLIVGVYTKNKLKSLFLSSFVVLLLLTVFFYIGFLVFLNPLIFGYGKVTVFDVSENINQWLVGVDHLSMSDGDGGGIFFYRLHIINQQTGQIVARQLIGRDFVTINKIDGQRVWLKFKDRMAVYNLLNGKEITP